MNELFRKLSNPSDFFREARLAHMGNINVPKGPDVVSFSPDTVTASPESVKLTGDQIAKPKSWLKKLVEGNEISDAGRDKLNKRAAFLIQLVRDKLNNPSYGNDLPSRMVNVCREFKVETPDRNLAQSDFERYFANSVLMKELGISDPKHFAALPADEAVKLAQMQPTTPSAEGSAVASARPNPPAN
jgi:hypothetical protein